MKKHIKESYKTDAEDYDWVDDNLNPIIPEESLANVDHDNVRELRYELQYDMLVNKDTVLEDEQINLMLMHFRLKGDVVKVFNITKKVEEQNQERDDKIDEILN